MKVNTIYIILILVIATVTFGLRNKPHEKEFKAIDKMPEYAGGNEAFLKDITSLVSFPNAAKRNNITGTVHVMFTINKAGKIANARIYKGVDTILDKEALSAINKVNKIWKEQN